MPLTNPNYIIDTTFTAKNITSPASVYTWTVAASAKVQILVAITIAGNGDYIAYLTHQWLGAGSAYVLIPKTTGDADSGETVIEFVTIPMHFKATDVVNVMIDGLANDASVSGVIRIVSDNYSIFDATADTVLTVAAPAAPAVPYGGILMGKPEPRPMIARPARAIERRAHRIEMTRPTRPIDERPKRQT